MKSVKRCPKCKTVKPRSEFYQKRDGTLSSYCKPCAKSGVQQWIRDNPERFRRNQRRSVLWCKYRMTEDDYDEMLAAQDGLCAICGATLDEAVINVDHCHQSGLIRGLLCARCNRTLGLFGDDPAILRRAISYLSSRIDFGNS